MDKFEALIEEGQVCVALLMNAERTDCEFLRCKPALPDAALREKLAEFAPRGLEYCGVFAIVSGQPRAALDTPLDARTVDALARAFLIYADSWLRLSELERAITAAAPVGDEVSWLRRLWSLPHADA